MQQNNNPLTTVTELQLCKMLERAVNFKVRNLKSFVLFAVKKKYFFRQTANQITALARQRDDSQLEENLNPVSVTMPAYQGNHPIVIEMKNELMRLKDDLFDAIIHGSFGTGEVIPYSDFDGLVILKDETVKDAERLARVICILNGTIRFMYQFDPLQHHGWFVLTEKMISRLDPAFFPAAIFTRSKSLLWDSERSFNVFEKNNFSKEEFLNLASGIQKMLHDPEKMKNAFFVKSLLSRFMMLPSLCYQVTNGTGIFKKESFEVVRKEFSANHWAVMEKVSALRTVWNLQINSFRKWILWHIYFLHPKLLAAVYPPVPANIRQLLTGTFFNEMEEFVLRMIAHLDENKNE